MTVNEVLAGLAVNPTLRVELLTVAHRHDLAVVDDVYTDWRGLAEMVQKLPFDRAPGAFPGLRLAMRARIPALDGLVVRLLASEHLLAAQDRVVFSLLAPLADFEYEQHIPHRDAAVQLGGVLYLCDLAMEGEGTGFYRHRPSGLQGVFLGDPELEEAARRSPFHDIGDFLWDLSHPRPGRSVYGPRPSQTWELTHAVDLRPNRLILFDSRLFHAALLPRTQYTRLTQNLFLRAQPEQALVRFRDPR